MELVDKPSEHGSNTGNANYNGATRGAGGAGNYITMTLVKDTGGGDDSYNNAPANTGGGAGFSILGEGYPFWNRYG